MTARTITTALLFAAALASGAVLAQQPAASRTVAKLTGVQGNVLVSQADSMAAAANEQALLPGVRVITTAGGKATVAYSNGCNVTLGENRRYTVRQQDACSAAAAPPLGKASGFAILAGTNVGNVGESVITGDLGVSPGKAVSGFPPGKVSVGAIHAGDETATEAQKDATKAYENLVGQRCDTKLTGQDLGGLTLTPGVYCFSPARLTGELILDAEGDLNAVWVFQATSLTTADKSIVKVINGGGRCNIYWQIAGAATLGKESEFSGTIISLGGIDAGEKAQGVGRALSRNGAVTLNAGAIDRVACLVPLGFWTPATTAAVGVAGAVAVGAGIVEINRGPKSPN